MRGEGAEKKREERRGGKRKDKEEDEEGVGGEEWQEQVGKKRAHIRGVAGECPRMVPDES